MLMYIAPCCLPTKRRREATSLCAVASISRRGKGRNAAGDVCLQRRCLQCIQTSKTVDLAEKRFFALSSRRDNVRPIIQQAAAAI